MSNGEHRVYTNGLTPHIPFWGRVPVKRTAGNLANPFDRQKRRPHRFATGNCIIQTQNRWGEPFVSCNRSVFPAQNGSTPLYYSFRSCKTSFFCWRGKNIHFTFPIDLSFYQKSIGIGIPTNEILCDSIIDQFITELIK